VQPKWVCQSETPTDYTDTTKTRSKDRHIQPFLLHETLPALIAHQLSPRVFAHGKITSRRRPTVGPTLPLFEIKFRPDDLNQTGRQVVVEVVARLEEIEDAGGSFAGLFGRCECRRPGAR
jgi:hypothetical protein